MVRFLLPAAAEALPVLTALARLATVVGVERSVGEVAVRGILADFVDLLAGGDAGRDCQGRNGGQLGVRGLKRGEEGKIMIVGENRQEERGGGRSTGIRTVVSPASSILSVCRGFGGFCDLHAER